MPPGLLRQDVLPVAVGYLLVMGALAAGLRLLRRDGDPAAARRAGPGAAARRAGPAAGWRRLARHYAGTALGGYLVLMAVVVLYYYGVVRVGGAFIWSAFTGCALLIALSTPVFALASWLAERRPGQPGRPPAAPGSPADPAPPPPGDPASPPPAAPAEPPRPRTLPHAPQAPHPNHPPHP